MTTKLEAQLARNGLAPDHVFHSRTRKAPLTGFQPNEAERTLTSEESNMATAPIINNPAQPETLIRYWEQGSRIIEGCLAQALQANLADTPIDLAPEQHTTWHRARAEAFQHALEMMGHPGPVGEEILARTIESSSKIVS